MDFIILLKMITIFTGIHTKAAIAHMAFQMMLVIGIMKNISVIIGFTMKYMMVNAIGNKKTDMSKHVGFLGRSVVIGFQENYKIPFSPHPSGMRSERNRFSHSL